MSKKKFKMIWILFIYLFLFFSSCKDSDEVIIKKIIDKSYFGIFDLKKMEEIDKSRENIFNIKVHSSIIQKYVKDVNPENNFEIVRYIYKTGEGVNRIYFIVNLTDRIIVNKSSNVDEFFKPIFIELFGDDITMDLEGNTLMQILQH